MPDINNYSDMKNTMNLIFKAIEKLNSTNFKSIYSIIESYYNVLSKIDYSATYNSISKTINKISLLMEKYCLEDSTQKEIDENIPDEIEEVINEMPIDETIKKDIVSSKEFKVLKKKEPWTKADKIAVIGLIITTLFNLYNILSSSENSVSVSTTNSIIVNVNTYNETENEHIEQLENAQNQLEELLESLLETIQIDETDDISNSSDSDYDKLTSEIQ